MSQDQINTLLEGLVSKHTALIDGVATMRNEVKQHGDATVETKSKIDGILIEQTKMRDELKALRLQFDTNAYGDGGAARLKSLGEQFTADEGYKSAIARGSHLTGPVTVKSLSRKDITSDTGSVGAGLPPALRLPNMIAAPHQPLRIRDLLTVIPTTLTALQYVKYTFTNAAAIVIDTIPNPDVREGVLKPKSDMTMTAANATAETIAHWVAASKQVVADIPTLRGIIDSELMFGLKFVEEAEILNGNGTAGHLNGLNQQATAFNTALVGGGATKIDKLRAMILQAELAQFPVDAHVLNPRDWYDMEMTKDDLGRYIIGNPQGGLNQTLWGIPVVKSFSQPYGTGLTGAFAMGATLYDRESANIEIRDTHADFFVRNMVAILCEERLMLVVTRPQAFIKATL